MLEAIRFAGSVRPSITREMVNLTWRSKISTTRIRTDLTTLEENR